MFEKRLWRKIRPQEVFNILSSVADPNPKLFAGSELIKALFYYRGYQK
jgi:hypothetical protein